MTSTDGRANYSRNYSHVDPDDPAFDIPPALRRTSDGAGRPAPDTRARRKLVMPDPARVRRAARKREKEAARIKRAAAHDLALGHKSDGNFDTVIQLQKVNR